MSVGLSSKVSIITGASSGLGQATAIMFARKGALVTLCGRDQDRLNAVQDECTQASGGHQDRFICVQGDLNDAKVREDIVAKTVQKFGRLDILVASAGILLPASTMEDTTEESFDQVFDTNVKSVFFLIQQALPHLVKSKGNVVSVSSGKGSMATCFPGITYPMSKAALDHMTRCLALDLGPRGIRVNAVKPSFVPTKIRRYWPGDTAEMHRKMEARESHKQPMGSIGTAEDVAEAISFLASDAAKFITGASSGLGQATAIMFARKGAMVTLCGRDQDRLKAVQDECTQASGGQRDRFICVQGDLNDGKVREDIVAKTVQKFGRLDVLVANAGVNLPAASIRNATEESFDEVFNTNVKSVFFLIQQSLPHLEKSKGNIVSVSSCLSSMACHGGITYPMTKASIDHMTRCLALDLGPQGIRVNAVKPSLVPTRMRRHFPGDMDELYRKMEEKESTKQPMGSIGKAEDVAEAISFLASDSAKFITGECLSVDGGRQMTGPQWPPSLQK